MKRNKIIYAAVVLGFIPLVVFALSSRASKKERVAGVAQTPLSNVVNEKEDNSVKMLSQKEIDDLEKKVSKGIPLTVSEEAALMHANIMSEENIRTTPATLEECYARLNVVSKPESKNILKNSKPENLILFNFDLGMWIRNFWIYPTYKDKIKISKFFLDQNIIEPDEMSYMIIGGYYYYLNGINLKTVDEIRAMQGDI